MVVSSGSSNSTNSLYMRPLAQRWLPVFNIVLCWLPALYYSTSLARNNSILHYKGYKRGNQIGIRFTTPELAPSPTYSPALAPYTDSRHPVLPQGFP